MTAKPKSEMMARLRAKRKAAGLVCKTIWIKPEHVDAINALVAELKGSEGV